MLLVLSEILPFGMGDEGGENVSMWWRRKVPVLINLLIIQQKYSHCFTKIYQKVQEIILHSHLFLSVSLSLSIPEYQKVGLKCSLLPLISFFFNGVQDHRNFTWDISWSEQNLCVLLIWHPQYLGII